MKDAASPEATAVLDAWRASSGATILLVSGLSSAVWPLPLPGSLRRTVGSLAAHLHNTRCLWLKALGPGHGILPPPRVSPGAASCPEVLGGLAASEDAIDRLLRAGIAAGGRFPGPGGGFVFGAIPRHATLFVAYAVSHESHHRGQLVAAVRQLGHRVAPEVVTGLWQWSSRIRDPRPFE